MKKYLWIVAFFAALSLVFTGCPDGGGDGNGNDTTSNNVTVTFNLNGGGSSTTVTVAKGAKVSRPANPTHQSAGFTFVDWFEAADADVDADEPFDFDTPINANKTLYAGWELDHDNYYFVTFYSEGEKYAIEITDGEYAGVVPIAQDGDKIIERPWWDPEKEGYLFIDWYDADTLEASSVPFDFTAELTDDVDLYAVFGRISDVIKANGGKGDFLDDWWLGASSAASALVINNGVPAIQIRPDGEDGNQYRMQFNFDEQPFDIRNFARIDIDFRTGTGAGAVNGGNISLLTGGDPEDASSWVKTMVSTGNVTNGQLRLTIGKALWFKSTELRALEFWSPSRTGNPSMYITSLDFTGTPASGDVIPELEEVTATNIFMTSGTTTPPQTSGTQTVSIPITGNTNVFFYFDSLGDDVFGIKVDFHWDSGANINHYGAYDSVGRKSNTSYINWMGYGDISLQHPLSTLYTGLDSTTFYCVAYTFANTSPASTITLNGITLYKVKE